MPCSCFIPPHILSHIAVNAPLAAHRAAAVRTLELTQSLSSARIGFVESVQPFQRTQRLGFALGLLQELALAGRPQRTIYDAQNQQRLPGNPVREEGDPDGPDPAINEAYNFMGDTYQFYWDVFGRDSVDDRGMPLNGTVHFEQNYDNAFWDGQRMIYGDGDGQQFERFTKSVDVIGHELTHGVTQYESGLIYWGEAGALNESLSDAFGSLVKQWVNNQTAAAADWIVGAGLFTPSVQGMGIRSMSAPGTAYDDPILGKDPQPATMSGYVRTLQDNGGVHINSGIPNHAFYLAAIGLGGYAWEKAGAIWYGAATSPLLRRTSGFRAFARITVITAQQLYGQGSVETEIIRQAWSSVGVAI